QTCALPIWFPVLVDGVKHRLVHLVEQALGLRHVEGTRQRLGALDEQYRGAHEVDVFRLALQPVLDNRLGIEAVRAAIEKELAHFNFLRVLDRHRCIEQLVVGALGIFGVLHLGTGTYSKSQAKRGHKHGKGFEHPGVSFFWCSGSACRETEGTADNSASMDSFYPTGTKKGSLWLPF